MDLILLAILFVTVLGALWPFLKKYKTRIEFQNLLNKIPGPTAFPLFGTTLAYIMTPREGLAILVHSTAALLGNL